MEAITSPLKVALLLNPAFGYIRYYRGGVALSTASYLDSIFYYFSALNADESYDCKEALNAAFDRCVHHHNLLQEQHRNLRRAEDKVVLRLTVMKYLSIMGKIWTRVDVDALDEMMTDFEWTLKELLRRCCRSSSSSTTTTNKNKNNTMMMGTRTIMSSPSPAMVVKAEVFNVMMACLLLCVDLCLQQEDPRHCWKDWNEKREEGDENSPFMFVISNRDFCMLNE